MKINLPYSDFKTTINDKGLTWQFKETGSKYELFSVDNVVTYQTELWKNGFEPKGKDVPSSQSDTSDFETNFKSSGNVKIDNTVKLTGKGNIVTQALTAFASRSFIFGHNYCDPTTWFGDSVRVVGEAVGTGDGAQTVFNLANTNVIDLKHGKITDEAYLVPSAAQGGSDFFVHVFLDAVEQTEDEPFGAANDYSVNYSTGAITFATAPGNGVAITADYFYENGSTAYIKPPTGYKTVITRAEAQFSQDIIMNDSLISAVFTYDPQQGAPPAKFEYPGTRTEFIRFYDFINYTNGSFPIIPTMGGGARGIANDILQLRWEYVAAIELADSVGAELRIWLKNDTAYGGEIGTITFYGYDELE